MTKCKSQTSTTAASAPTRQGHAAKAETAVQRSKPARGKSAAATAVAEAAPRDGAGSAVRSTAQGKDQER